MPFLSQILLNTCRVYEEGSVGFSIFPFYYIDVEGESGGVGHQIRSLVRGVRRDVNSKVKTE